jgi:hypothetical protein
LFAEPPSLKSKCTHHTPKPPPPRTLSTIHEEDDDTDSAAPQPKRKGQPMTPFCVSPTKKAQLKTPSRLSASSQPVDTNQLRRDHLGTLVNQLISHFELSSSWEEFVKDFRGRSYLATELDHVEHPAAELLRQWRDEGVPAMTTAAPLLGPTNRRTNASNEAATSPPRTTLTSYERKWPSSSRTSPG